MQNSINTSQSTESNLYNSIKEDLSESNTNILSLNMHNPKKSEKIFLCEHCNKLFSTKGNLRNHISTIHKNYRPFKCSFPNCEKKYECECKLIAHERTHTGIKPFVCPICQNSFFGKGNLKEHLKTHSEIRPFKCPLCDNTYKTNGALKKHIKINHDHILKFSCEYCEKKFGTNSALKQHIIKHTKEKKFKCKYIGCEKCFTEKRNMEKHYNRHFQLEEKKRKRKGNKKYDLNIYQKNSEEVVNIAASLLDFIQKKEDEQLKNEEKNEIKNITDISNMSKENHTSSEINSNQPNIFLKAINLPSNNINDINN